MISYKIVDEVERINQKIRFESEESKNWKGESAGPLIQKIKFRVNKNFIQGKRVVFIYKSISVEMIKKILKELESTFISEVEYALKSDVDIVVSKKFGTMKQKELSISEE